jgi:uncharacterized integral membrane protein
MKIKLWISLILAFMVFIFITQNTETVDVSFLAWSVEMSLVLLVFIMLGSGLIIGWLLNSYVRHGFKKSKERQQQAGDQSVQGATVATHDNTNAESREEKDINE